MANVYIDNLIGRIYLTPPVYDRTQQQLTIVEYVQEIENKNHHDRSMIQFRAQNNDKSVSEIITCNQLLESEDGHKEEWRFKAILNHKRP